MISARRALLVSSAFTAAALMTVLTPGSAGARFAPDVVTIDPIGKVAPDGTLTLTGTYQCSVSRSEPVFVGSKVVQNGAQANVGGTVATCDGREHIWSNTGAAAGAFRTGLAVGEATLLALESSGGLVPSLVVVATDYRGLSLLRGQNFAS